MRSLRLLTLCLLVTCGGASAAEFGPGTPLYEAQPKTGNVTSVQCWFKVAPDCPEGAYVFDKLVEGSRCAFRL